MNLPFLYHAIICITTLHKRLGIGAGKFDAAEGCCPHGRFARKMYLKRLFRMWRSAMSFAIPRTFFPTRPAQDE